MFATTLTDSRARTTRTAVSPAPANIPGTVTSARTTKVAQDTLLPNADRALDDADVRHRFVISGVWDLAYGRSLKNPVLNALMRDYQLSVISNIRSGRHFSATTGGDPNNDGNARSDRSPYVGRNTIEGPGFAGVDLCVTRDIRIREKLSLKLIGEAFNLTNRANFSGFNQGQYNYTAATRVFVPTTNYLIRTSTFDPRILQLAAKITF